MIYRTGNITILNIFGICFCKMKMAAQPEDPLYNKLRISTCKDLVVPFGKYVYIFWVERA